METARTTFFTKDKNFYKTFFRLMLVVALQNLVAYSVNMLDNIMLGSYSQNALSGAATVNQIFFIVNQLALSIGNALVAICSQYWGKQETEEIRKLTGAALALSILIAAVVVTACTCMPEWLLGIFTTSPEIIAEGKAYLGLLKWTFLLFMISNLLIAMLRSVEVVKISFVISVVSLITNGCINYTLIFGHFGFPEMGIRGAAVGTLTVRMLELLIIVVYVWKIDTKVRLFDVNLIKIIFAPENRKIWRAFLKVAFPIMCSGMIWAISVPMQTAILGHLSADAIAANSVSSTFFQYLKVIVIAISSASAVVIGKDIGEGDIERVKSDGRTLSVIDLLIGAVLASLLFVLRGPLLSMYKLTDTAAVLADHFIMIMSIVMVGMSYQMPVSVGVIQGGGDTKFSMYTNMISTWGIVMPLSFLAAFVWKLPVELEDVRIKTPICEMVGKQLSGKKLAVVPILRAGLGMVDGMLNMIPSAKVGHIGLYRDPETYEPVEYYCKLPSDCDEREVFVVDPMLATGGSCVAALQMLKDKGVKHMRFMCIIAAPEGVKRLQEAHPDVDIYIGALDDHLNEHKYIVPGLGDAGDRIFGTK